jgi:hypothetical protein
VINVGGCWVVAYRFNQAANPKHAGVVKALLAVLKEQYAG